MSIVKGTLLLASAFLLAVLIVKPIGVSTQFVIFDGIVMDSVNPDYVTESTKNKTGYESQNAYLNKSGGKYAKSVANPINYSFVFVLAMMVGAFRLPLGMVGKMDESTTRKLLSPCTRVSGPTTAIASVPILHEQDGW